MANKKNNSNKDGSGKSVSTLPCKKCGKDQEWQNVMVMANKTRFRKRCKVCNEYLT